MEEFLQSGHFSGKNNVEIWALKDFLQGLVRTTMCGHKLPPRRFFFHNPIPHKTYIHYKCCLTLMDKVTVESHQQLHYLIFSALQSPQNNLNELLYPLFTIKPPLQVFLQRFQTSNRYFVVNTFQPSIEDTNFFLCHGKDQSMFFDMIMKKQMFN